MPAAVIGGVIAGAGAIGAAAIGSKAQKKAAKAASQAQTQAASQNNALQREIYDRNTANLAPFMSRGNIAGETYNALLGLGGDANAARSAFDTFRGSTGYDFRVKEGQNALTSSLAGSRILQSGAAAKALERFRQGTASDEFGRYLGYLGNQQGIGLSGANALAGVGTNFANAVSANNQNAADATSNAALIRGQANANIFGTAANAIGNIGAQFASSYGSRPNAMVSQTPAYSSPGYVPTGVIRPNFGF